jgi:hypothetical protein
MERKWSRDHVRVDIVQKVINDKQLKLIKYCSEPLKIRCVHDIPVVQPKELHKRILEYKLA